MNVSQDKIQSSNMGRARRETAAGASGSSRSVPVHPDEQGPDTAGSVSPLGLSKLSTTPPLDKVNKTIDRWLSNTQTPSGSASPLVKNQENSRLSSDPASAALDELTKELQALAKHPFNAKGKSGTSAPANTPYSEDCSGLRARAQSTGDACGRRVCMGPQAKTMEEGDLPTRAMAMDEIDVPRPLFSKSNSTTVAERSTLLPQINQSSTTPDDVKLISSNQPNKSVECTSSPSALAQTSGVTETNIPALPTAIAQPSQPSTSPPALAGPEINSLGVAENLLEQNQGIPPDATHLLTDSVTGRPSAPTHAAPFLTPPTLPGATVNAYGLAQPPSLLSFQQHAQHNLPVATSTPAHLGRVITEAESFNDSPNVPRFQDFSGIGRQHSPHASTGESSPMAL